MANHHGKIKQGMGGSRNGRSRWEKTEVLKADSKKARRAMVRAEIEAELAEIVAVVRETGMPLNLGDVADLPFHAYLVDKAEELLKGESNE